MGGWLALFALAVQLTLSFGHIHAEDFHAKDLHAKDPALPTLNVAGEAGGAPATPNSDHDDCPICVAAHLTAATALPIPPQFAVPVATPVAWHAAIERRIDQPTTRQPFQARAPPQA